MSMENKKLPLWKEIFGRIWALWMLISWIITILIAFIFYLPSFFIKEPAAAAWHRKVSRVWQAVYLRIVGCPYKIIGLENFKKGKTYVIVCNHSSFLDILLATPFTAKPNKTIAKSSFAPIPVFGWIYAKGSILVDRKNAESRTKSYLLMKKAINQGFDMVIYPEGTRNRTSKPLQPFQNGAFKLAEDMKVPILPSLILYTGKVLPPNKVFFAFPHPIEIHYLPAISSEGISAKSLKEKVFSVMESAYVDLLNK